MRFLVSFEWEFWVVLYVGVFKFWEFGIGRRFGVYFFKCFEERGGGLEMFFDGKIYFLSGFVF